MTHCLLQARLFDEPQLASLCLENIDKNTADAITAEGFTDIDLGKAGGALGEFTSYPSAHHPQAGSAPSSCSGAGGPCFQPCWSRGFCLVHPTLRLLVTGCRWAWCELANLICQHRQRLVRCAGDSWL